MRLEIFDFAKPNLRLWWSSEARLRGGLTRFPPAKKEARLRASFFRQTYSLMTCLAVFRRSSRQVFLISSMVPVPSLVA